MLSHIESDFTPNTLQYLPPDLFSQMKHLAFIHLGGVHKLTAVPELTGLHKLLYLVLAVTDSLIEYPSFDGLDKLAVITLVNGAHVEALPSLAPLTSLKQFSLVGRNAMCCNGYMTGTCNLTAASCYPRVDEAPVTCTADRMPESDWQVLNRSDALVCAPFMDFTATAPTEATTDDTCGGVMYKQCTNNGVAGMCFNVRMQVVVCDTEIAYENMRRLQIQRGVGDPCDPAVEAWLGCGAKA